MRNLISIAILISACGGATTAPRAAPQAATPTLEPSIEVSGDLLALMPTAVTSFGAAADGEHLYVLGGYHGTPHDYHRDGQSASFSRVALDGRSSWEDLGRIDRGLQGLALVAHDGALCRVGGSHATNAQGEPLDMRSVADAACWSSRTRTWEGLPALPSGRSSHAAVMIDETLYVVGGWDQRGGPDRASFADHVLALDVHAPANGWRRVPQPFQRRALGAAAANGKLIAIGGMTADRQVSPRVDVLDPRTGQWARGPDFPSDAFGLAAVGVGDDVYASARDGTIRRWHVGSTAWEDVANLAFPRFFHQLVAAGDRRLVAVGGISGMHEDGRTRQVEVVELDDQDGSMRVWTLHNPGRGRNRQAMFVQGDFLYVFGGNTSQEQHDFEPERFVDDGWRLHLPSMSWSRAPSYPARRQSMTPVVVGDRTLVVGGFGHDGTSAVTQPEVYAFDSRTQAWSQAGTLPVSRTQLGLAVHGGALWVFGGLNYDPARGAQAFDHLTNVVRAQLDSDLVFEQTPAALPGQRRAFAGAMLGDRFVMISGMRDGFELVEDCIAMRLPEGTIEPFPCASRPRLSAELVEISGRLYLVGGSVRGEGGMRGERAIEVFDPSSSTWSTLPTEVPFETRHLRALSYRGRLLLVSLTNEEGILQIAIVDPPGP